MKKLFKVVLVLSMVTVILTGCEFNKEEEKGASVGNEEKYSDKILTDQEAIAIGKDLYDKALKLKRRYITEKGEVSYESVGFVDGMCPVDDVNVCYDILAGYDEYADEFLTKEVKKQFITEDDNLSRTEDGKVKYAIVVQRAGDISAMSVDFEVKSKEKDEIIFDATQYYCDDIEKFVNSGICPKDKVKVRETNKYVISKENDIWKVKEATITFK